MTKQMAQFGIENLCSKDHCHPECAEHFIRAFCNKVEETANSDELWAYITWVEKLEAAFKQVKRELLGDEGGGKND